MANRTWTGTTDGDFDTAGNWSEAAVPVTGDVIIFNQGAVDLDTNVSQAGVSPAGVIVTPGYTGAIGASGSELTFGTITELLFDSGGSSAFIYATTYTAAYVLGGLQESDMLHLSGTLSALYASGGNGTLNIAASSTISDLVIDAGAVGLTVSIGASATFTLLRALAGQINAATGPITGRLGGSARMTCTGAAASGTLLDISNQAQVDWQATGTIADLVIHGGGGLFDARLMRSTGGFTITDSAVYTGGTMNIRNNMNNVTLTNPTKMRGGVRVDDYGVTSGVTL